MSTTSTPKVLGILALLAAVGLILLGWMPERGGEPAPMRSWRGETMGTTYEVQIVSESMYEEQVAALQQRVDEELEAVNAAMSTWIPDSAISRFNAREAGEDMEVDERFREVVIRAREMWADTGGAFDPTLGPLIDIWGFGAEGAPETPPANAEVEAARAAIGMENVVLEENRLRKTRADLELNLSAIAKGYAVDRVAGLLRREGIENLYVEIGGELACRGVNNRGIPWRIGIQVPERGAAETSVKVLSLADRALATSGDYRNYAEGGRHHILDPRTGRPAEHALASVSVLAGDCMTADAVATALYVMGTAEGMAWLAERPHLDALFIDREDGGFTFTATPGFDAALVAVP